MTTMILQGEALFVRTREPFLKLDQVIADVVIVTHLRDPDMPAGPKTGGGIQGAGGNRNAGFAAGIPKQAGAADPAEPAMDIRGFVGGGPKPLKRVRLNQNQVFPIRRGVGSHMSMKTPAFAAVAVDHIHQWTMDFKPHPAAKTATRRRWV